MLGLLEPASPVLEVVRSIEAEELWWQMALVQRMTGQFITEPECGDINPIDPSACLGIKALSSE